MAPQPRGDTAPDSSALGGHPAPDPGTPGDDADGAPAGEAAAPADGEPQSGPAGEAAELLRQVAGKAATAGAALDDGDTAAALAEMDAVCAAATQAPRYRHPAATPPARPGPAGTTS